MIYEDGRQLRDFVHVRDAARAFRLAMERPGVDGEVFNIGSGRNYNVETVARLLAEAMGRPDLPPQMLGKARRSDIRPCLADITRATDRPGSAPRPFPEDNRNTARQG